MEYAAGDDHLCYAGLSGKCSHQVQAELNDGAVEPGGDEARGQAPSEVVDNSLYGGSEIGQITIAVIAAQGVWIGLRIAIGHGHLQGDGGLALEGVEMAEAQKRTDGIEEPAATGGER
ncbi:hypothetical protein ES705_43359 [subsurface metagenome]